MPALKESPVLSKLETAALRVDEIDRLLSQPVRTGQHEIQRLNKERAELAPQAELHQAFSTLLRQITEAEEMLEDPRSDMKELAREELKELQGRRAELEGRARELLIVKDPRDAKNTFIEVRAGTGGEEAALFAAELVRMYTRYAEQRRWRVELMDSSLTELGGVKEAVLLIEGKGVYSRFKHESGVHRVQRVPATEGSGRIHTSTVTVAVMAEAEEVDVQIDPKDLKIDTFCSSGAGGQSVNTTYSAVRITHIPTGIVVSCQDERSQLKNRNKAMRNLRSRIMDAEKEKQDSEIAQQRKSQVGTGDRSEKIRTYNFAQNRVTDHRVGLTLHRLDQVLQGDLDEIIDALIASDQMWGPD
ncbi:MAG: peptide chain release factor 1 [Nitrospirae bacterium]|nr:MAG: peptide chain release factor 1 [Nitrospirota bacterium]